MDFIFFFFVSGFIALLLLIFSIPSGNKAWIYRAISIFLFTLFLPSSFLSHYTLVGVPRPIDYLTLETFGEEVEILGYYFIQNKGIYIWANLIKGQPATYLSLPWKEKLASEMTKAADEAEKQGSALMMDLKELSMQLKSNKSSNEEARDIDEPTTDSFDSSLDNRPPVFHPAPPRNHPPKTVPPSPDINVFDPSTVIH